MEISHYNPAIGPPNIIAEVSRRGIDPHKWFIQWQKMPIPRTEDTAENYRLASYALPMYDLSGPLRTNARRIELFHPAPSPVTRQFPDGTIGGAGLLNGQVFSQPLYDNDAGGFTSQLNPIITKPFNGLFDGSLIAPAGVA